MCKAFLDPIAVETKFVEQRRSGPSEVVNSERFERKPFLLGSLDHEISYAVERGPRHRRIGIVA